MERKKRASKKICTIEITPYLAEYARKKFHASTLDGSIRIPSTSDLYHCVWNNMQRPPSSSPALAPSAAPVLALSGASAQPPAPVLAVSAASVQPPSLLLISLPSRRPSSTEGPWKDPAYYNYISPQGAREVETCLRREFNFEFHRVMLENEAAGHPRRNIDVVDDFICEYRLQSITSDALLKNYYRYRDLIRPKQRRRYSLGKPRRR